MGDNPRRETGQGKWCRVDRAGTVRRERLHRALDRAFTRRRKQSVVWLEGPPGSGKTLLSEVHLCTYAHLCHWVRVEPRTWDADLDAAFAGTAHTVVIDNLQRVAPAELADLFNRIVAAPPTVRFLLISRTGPPPFVKKTPVKPVVIGWRQLQLTLTEAEQIAAAAGRSDLPRATVARMHTASGGWVAGFAWLLARARPEAHCTAAVRRALADYFSTVDAPLADVEVPENPLADRWPVRVRTLGPFEVITPGGPLDQARKAQKKPLELFELLISAGEQGLPEAQVIDVLWPDAEGDAGLRALATTLHRLRALIRCDSCLVRSHGWMRVDAGNVWVDAWAFEKYLGDAESNADAGRIEAALRLYRGPFLAATGDPPWVLDTRSRLRGLYVRHLMRLSEACAERGAWGRMEEINRLGLLADPLAEPFYQGLMTACLEQGRRTEADDAYRRCRTVLDEALGLAPSAATEAVYARMK